MKHAIKRGSMLTLVFALLFSPLAMSALYAANGIETDRTDASIIFDTGMEYQELEGLEIPVKIYQVADVSASGVYTGKKEFKQLNFSDVNSNTTAQQWREKAAEAVRLADENNILPENEIVLNSPDNMENAVKDLPVGLYLIQAETVESSWYEYSFSPFLLSLPNNYYDPEDSSSDDAWVYHVEADLKPDRTDRYGDLEIQKNLISYNETFGSAYFVFRIEAVKEGENVYSDVVSLNFKEAGEKKLLVSHIPAGAEVTVTEIYSGASYTAVSGKEQSAVILAEGTEGNPVSVSFENEYDKRLNSGSGIVNHFKFENDAWDWEQKADSAGEEQSPSDNQQGTKDDSQTDDREDAKEQAEEIASGENGEKTSRIQKASSIRREVSADGSRAAAVNASGQEVQAEVQKDAQPQENDAENDPKDDPEAENLTKEEDEHVPLASLAKEIFSDENTRLITVIGAAVLAGVMALTFGVVLHYRRARIHARSRRIPIKRK